MAEVSQISAQDFTSYDYDEKDLNLIPSFEIDTTLEENSYIEYFVYNLNGEPLAEEYAYDSYIIQNDGQSSLTNQISQIIIDPEADLVTQGLNQGEYNTYYSFLNKKVGTPTDYLYITEISSDRTELRLDSNTISNDAIVSDTTAFVQQRNDSKYFIDFYLNFGQNQLILANNIQLDNTDPSDPTILIKLYEPLPTEFDIKSELWVVTLIENPLAYNIVFEEEVIEFQDSSPIQGPNFNIDLKDQINNSTDELSYNDLISSNISSSNNQLDSLLSEKDININVDYTDFENFVHFSSAKTRLENFYYKVSLIEDYSSSIAQIQSGISGPTSGSSAVVGSIATFESQINNVIKNFDKYEYFLYYTSGSFAWPKTTSEPPYLLATTGSTAVLDWFGSLNESNPYFGGRIYTSSIFDEDNKDNLVFAIPEYLREDPENAPYELFVNMLGQHYDNVWVYTKDVTEKYNNDNRLDFGISKDLVADAIRDFGIKIYQNNFSKQDLYTAFLGSTDGGALFPFPFITGSLPTPTGYEYVDTLISASNDYIPLDDVNKSLYKRIYHNLPYLLKTKGTLPGLRALITSYGIPDTILRISEFGGKDKVNVNDWDYYFHKYNKKFDTEGTNYITTDWTLNTDWNATNDRPSTVQLRFQAETPVPTNYSQSVWSLDDGSNVALVLEYTGSALASGSYSGSIIDPYYQYATLKFTADGFTNSSSIYLPFFNGEWWNVMVTNNSGTYTLHAGDKIYNGNDGTSIGFYETSSHTAVTTNWDSGITSSFSAPTTITPGGTTYQIFSGSYQELRYYTSVITGDVFKDYVMNPLSIEGNSINSAPNELAFRAALGSELSLVSSSIHPKVTGSWAITSSFVGDSDYVFGSTPTYSRNTEYYFLDQPNSGIKARVSDKVRFENNVLPEGDTLSALRRIAQPSSISSSYTENINYLEVAFSPQNEINDDINSQIGFFNIGEYIGDPSFRSSSLNSYPDLDTLRDDYFKKYTKNYDAVDYIRLIKFFDNSLFKMIKDFIPARTSLASGIVIKQHILERNRYKAPTATTDNTIAKYGKSGSIIWNEPLTFKNIEVSGTVKPQWNDFEDGRVYNPVGSSAGTFNKFNSTTTSPSGSEGNGPNNIFNVTQSWNETYPTLSGSVTVLHDSQDEFYNGEFSGSVILVTTQNLNTPYPLENVALNYKHVYYFATGSGEQSTFLSNFLSPNTSPQSGEILFLCNIPGSKPTFFNNAIVNVYTVTHIKISKQDCSNIDSTLPLGQLTQLVIRIPIFDPLDPLATPQTITYDINGIQEYSDYYLYETSYFPWIITNQIGGITDPNKDQQLFDYAISSSVTASYNVGDDSPKTIINWNSTLPGTNLPHYGTSYFNTSSGIITFENTPNTPIQVSASISTFGNDPTSRFIRFIRNRGGATTTLTQATYNAGASVTTLLNSIIYPVQGDQYYFELTKTDTGVSVNVVSASISTTQNRNQFILDSSYTAPLNSSCSLAILQPYITTPNFYNSDENALLNDVSENQTSFQWYDIDYTSGILTPSNFDAIISGSALKAQVQDSNYTSRGWTNARYNGSRNTTTLINKWTNSGANEGNYGKTPSVESRKSIVVWAQDTRGWAPEKMDRSLVTIKYLIDETGKAITPNAVETSLGDVQNAFRSGEDIILTSFSPNPTNNDFSDTTRIIDRGGYTIEPIMHNQISHYQDPNTPMSFTGSIIFSNPSGIELTPADDYRATLTQPINSNGQLYTPTIGPVANVGYPDVIYEGTLGVADSNRYTILQDLLDNINGTLNLLAKLKVSTDVSANYNGGQITSNPTVTLSFYNLDNIGQPANFYLYQKTFNPQIPFASNQTGPNSGTWEYTFEIEASIPIQSSGLSNSDRIFVGIQSNINLNVIQDGTNIYKITHTPTPPVEILSGSLFNLPTGVGQDPTVLYITNEDFLNVYGDPNMKQRDIPNSGFNKIKLPIEFLPGDEIRFQGGEDKVVEVIRTEQTASAAYNGTGSVLLIYTNRDISNVLWDETKFAVRRYVDNPGQIIISRDAVFESQGGPLLVKPDYITNQLNENLDDYITNLTNEGLL
jgi:hypothetical protein